MSLTQLNPSSSQRATSSRAHWLLAIAALLLVAAATGCAAHRPVWSSKRTDAQYGMASYYAHKFHGRQTASGEVFDMHAMTAAHRKLPFGTRVKVTNLRNQKSVVLKINDRGPFKKGRIIDVSYGAAQKLDMIRDGVTKVRVQILG